MSRKAFQRLSLDARRSSLLEATLLCIARHGLHGATVRGITEEAGVTAGLVRHYFGGKDELVRNAYAYLVGQLTAEAAECAKLSQGSAESQLERFLRANMTPPNLSDHKVSLWATFVGRVRQDTSFAEIHREGYKEFLSLLATLIEPVLAIHGRPHDATTVDRHAIALNGLIDGLWMEGSLNTGLYGQTVLPDLLVDASERLLGLAAGTLTNAQTPLEK